MFDVEELRGKTLDSVSDGKFEETTNKTPEQLRSLVEILDAHLRSLHQTDTGELRDLDDAEEKAFAYGLAVREDALKKIEHHRSVSEVFSRRPEAVKRVYANINRGLDAAGSAARLLPGEARDLALRTLDSRSASAHLAPEEKDQVERHIRRSPDVARRIIVTENDAYRNAWMKMVTRPDGAMYLSEEERDAMRAFDEYRAASLTTTAGGFGVPVFIDPSIILTAQGSGNPFLTIAKQVESNTNVWKGVSSAGVTWSFDAEGVEASDDAPTLAQPSVTIHMARGLIPYSIEIGEDYPGFASEMSTLLAEGYDELLVDKFTRGSGSGEPFGILTVLSASAGNRVSVQTAGTNFSAQDPYAVWSAVPQRFRRKASWMMSVDVNNKLRQLGGANVFHANTVQLPAEWAETILGRTVYESPYMPNTTTSTSANSGLAIVGDFAGYVIARRTGMSIELVPHLLSTTTNLPNGQRAWFAYSRIGANVVNTAAFRLLVNTA